MSLHPETVGVVPAIGRINAERVVKLFQIARWADGPSVFGALEELRDALWTAREFAVDGALPCPARVWDGVLALIEEWVEAPEAIRKGALVIACMGAADLLHAHLESAADAPVERTQPKHRGS